MSPEDTMNLGEKPEATAACNAYICAFVVAMGIVLYFALNPSSSIQNTEVIQDTSIHVHGNLVVDAHVK